ncbi:MAG: hypothetical protein GF418_13810 [Chitinivibrionales bacterium]|nr:hypothetical protein [Chitinivibrionales bacterium]MBD3396697.1 hypothetical protein [Chitinivibrionales bacterium]
MITDNDTRCRRCPMLGHDVTFSYCRMPGGNMPCARIFDCWWETFDIKGFVEEHYDRDTIARLISPPKPKAASLLDLIEQARKRTGG